MYALERFEERETPLGTESVRHRVSEWETWQQGLEAFLRFLGDRVNGGGGVVVTAVHLGMTTASATVEDTWAGTSFEIVLAWA